MGTRWYWLQHLDRETRLRHRLLRMIRQGRGRLIARDRLLAAMAEPSSYGRFDPAETAAVLAELQLAGVVAAHGRRFVASLGEAETAVAVTAFRHRGRSPGP
jgi:hypothetical protein